MYAIHVLPTWSVSNSNNNEAGRRDTRNVLANNCDRENWPAELTVLRIVFSVA